MKNALIVASMLASSAMVRLATADVGCPPPEEPCPPVYEADAGVCAGHDDIGNTCGGDAGTCGIIPPWCAHNGHYACLGPVPPAPPYRCGSSDGSDGCTIAGDPGRVARHAALPSALLIAGALALFLDRRRGRSTPESARKPGR